jgi:hypothetical protein
VNFDSLSGQSLHPIHSWIRCVCLFRISGGLVFAAARQPKVAKHKVSQPAIGTFRLGNVITGNNGLCIPLMNLGRPRFCCSPLAKWLQAGPTCYWDKIFGVSVLASRPTAPSSQPLTLNGRPRFSLVYLGASDPTCTLFLEDHESLLGGLWATPIS